jgi:hypothetical protein
MRISWKPLALIGLGLLVVGCWGSKFALGPALPVDKALVGDWKITDSDGSTTNLIIRNLDGKQYYVETGEPGKEPERYVGFIADVKGAHFAHLRPLKKDGDLPEEYIYMRVELDAGKLVIRDLDEEFFKGKNFDSAEAVQKFIGDNLDNPKMYGKSITGTCG